MHFDAVVSKLLPLALGSIAYFAIGVIASPPTSAHPTPIRVVTNTVSAAGPSDTSPPVAEEYNDAPGDLVNTMSGNATFACNYWEKIPTEWSSLDNIIYSFQNVDPRTDVDLPSTVNTTNNLNCTDNTKVEAVFYGTVVSLSERTSKFRKNRY